MGKILKHYDKIILRNYHDTHYLNSDYELDLDYNEKKSLIDNKKLDNAYSKRFETHCVKDTINCWY